jgi:Family of unknown function (DUF5677)
MSIKNEQWELQLDDLVRTVDDGIHRIRHFLSTDEPTFEQCCKASSAKCVDYNAMLSRLSSADACQFLAPALRSMCEGLIVLKYLLEIEQSVADRIVRCALACELNEKLETQSNFFTQYRAHQVVPSLKIVKSQTSNPSNDLRKAWKECGCEVPSSYSAMPSIWQLAKCTQLESFYRFFYNFSSATVHFSTHQLFRSGWGPTGEEQEWSFSAAHLSGYFYLVCRIYGAYLLSRYLILLNDRLQFGDDLQLGQNKLDDFLESVSNWPEIVSYEELNLKRPPDPHPMLTAVLKHRVSKSIW